MLKDYYGAKINQLTIQMQAADQRALDLTTENERVATLLGNFSEQMVGAQVLHRCKDHTSSRCSTCWRVSIHLVLAHYVNTFLSISLWIVVHPFMSMQTSLSHCEEELQKKQDELDTVRVNLESQVAHACLFS